MTNVTDVKSVIQTTCKRGFRNSIYEYEYMNIWITIAMIENVALNNKLNIAYFFCLKFTKKEMHIYHWKSYQRALESQNYLKCCSFPWQYYVCHPFCFGGQNIQTWHTCCIAVSLNSRLEITLPYTMYRIAFRPLVCVFDSKPKASIQSPLPFM